MVEVIPRGTGIQSQGKCDLPIQPEHHEVGNK
jgi:hypothetical protein